MSTRRTIREKFDCHAKAYPDEPMFVLLGRDEDAPAPVRAWADKRMARVGLLVEDSDLEKIEEARACAGAMKAWRLARR